MASCDEATQLRRQRDVGPVHPHAFAEDPARQPAAAAAAAAAATHAGDRLLLEMSQTPSREAVMSSIFSHFDADGTGALSHKQFQGCFALVSSEVTLGVEEWQELCSQLGVRPPRNRPLHLAAHPTVIQ